MAGRDELGELPLCHPGLVEQTTTAFNVADFVFSEHYQPEAFCRDCLLYCIDTYYYHSHNIISQQLNISNNEHNIISLNNEHNSNMHIISYLNNYYIISQQLNISSKEHNIAATEYLKGF